MTQATPSLKPFAAWVTGLTDRYRFDQQVRITVQIVALQAGLGLLTVLVFGWGIHYAQEDTLRTITAHISEMVSGAPSGPDTLPESISEVRTRTYGYVLGLVVLINLLFGYLVAQFALKPARQTFAFQKRFIGDVAHELRTPLSIIKTSTEVALMDASLPKNVRTTFEEVNAELNRVSETINNVLSFNALMRPRPMPFAPVDLGVLAHQVVAQHRELARSRDIALEERIAPGMFVSGNPAALEQAIANLVKNALAFTPSGKDCTVTVEVDRDARGGVFVSVADTGIGINQTDLYHVFEPFYRADTSRARGVGTGAAGLGLAIVNEIVRLHKGTITLRSAPKRGTTVRIALPAAKERKVEELPVLAPSGSPHEATLDFSSVDRREIPG